MLIVKYMGMALVFLACMGVGRSMARGVRTELDILEELLRLMRRVGSDIRCYKRPLSEIYGNFSSELPKDFFILLQRGRTADAFSLLLNDAVPEVCVSFFDRVGKCSSEECDRLEAECCAELSRLIEEKRETVESKAKVYRSLGLAGGAAAVILLL